FSSALSMALLTAGFGQTLGHGQKTGRGKERPAINIMVVVLPRIEALANHCTGTAAQRKIGSDTAPTASTQCELPLGRWRRYVRRLCITAIIIFLNHRLTDMIVFS